MKQLRNSFIYQLFNVALNAFYPVRVWRLSNCADSVGVRRIVMEQNCGNTHYRHTWSPAVWTWQVVECDGQPSEREREIEAELSERPDEDGG